VQKERNDMQGLEGVKVLELGHMVSAAYATKLMADLGAEVIKMEEPEGDYARQRGPYPKGVADREQSGLFLSLNTNKRGITLDLPQERDSLCSLVAWADVLIHNYPPARMAELGIDYHTFRTINPRLVMCSITPFGLTGPYHTYKAYELTLAHGGGWAWLSPGGSDRPDLPPLKAFGHQCEFQTGLIAAMTAMAMYMSSLHTGAGEHIDLSAHACVASFVELNAYFYSYLGKVASRLGKKIIAPLGIYECQDGLILLLAAQPDQLQRFIELMGNPEWAQQEAYRNPFTLARHIDVVDPYLREWIKAWKVEDLFRVAQERRICVAPVCTMGDLATQKQLHERGFFVEVSHPRAGTLTHLGAPYRLHEPWWQIRRPAPLLGEHNDEVKGSLKQVATSHGQVAVAPSESQRHRTSNSEPRTQLPLAGVRVAAFTWAWAGPYSALQLAHLGAEVIHVESQTRIDGARLVPIHPTDVTRSVNTSGYFNQWNQGTKSIALNLSKPEAVAIAKQLVQTCDVVVENFATGVMARLGLGYEDLKKTKPDLIMASISGYGHTGPQRHYMGYGPAMAPLAGLSSLTGYIGGPPQEVGMAYGDPNGGINAAVAICAALVARQRTGRGQYIDVSLWEAMAVLVAEGWMDYAMNKTQPSRMGNRDPLMAPHNCFRCAGEDEWVSIACGTDDEWQALCQAIGEPQLAADPRFRAASDRKVNEDDLERALTAWTESRTKWDVTRTLQNAGVAAFPSITSKDLAEDPHLTERGFFVRLPHAEVGVRTHAGMPWLLPHAPNGVRAPAPLLGEHTDWVMRDLLGYAAPEIARLREEHVLY
jgi:crotonobetainyl-CoA:carnitine CoA-transferase CaiB-like acyl-CoA transferase